MSPLWHPRRRHRDSHPMRRRAWTVFPPELVDCIIDNLSDDLNALGKCALVSTQWLPRSRHHQFAEVKLTEDNMETFWTLLESSVATHTLLPYVQALHFDGDMSSQREMEAAMEAGAEVIGHLGRVQTVTLDLFHWDDFNLSFQEAFMGAFRKLKVLNLRSVSFASANSAANFICGFRVLETLRVEFVRWKLASNPLDAPPVPRSLRTLRVMHSAQVLQWLSMRQSHIERVFLRNMLTTDTSHLSLFFRTLGTSLKFLYLSPLQHDPNVSDALCRKVVLTENTMLDSLKFVVAPNIDAQNSWPTAILSGLRSARIRDLTLAVTVEAYHKVDVIDWGVIDSCRELQRVTVWLLEPEGRFNRMKVPRRIVSWLPGCCERGTLRLFSSKPFRPDQRPVVHMGFKCYKFDISR